ncbi:hypothetical protein [Dethiosulfatibacter aminovorans]|nr:hypothetical protein [Dethiosulfatibacter aminovorans]
MEILKTHKIDISSALLQDLLKENNLKSEDVDCVVLTGTGRNFSTI